MLNQLNGTSLAWGNQAMSKVRRLTARLAGARQASDRGRANVATRLAQTRARLQALTEAASRVAALREQLVAASARQVCACECVSVLFSLSRALCAFACLFVCACAEACVQDTEGARECERETNRVDTRTYHTQGRLATQEDTAFAAAEAQTNAVASKVCVESD